MDVVFALVLFAVFTVCAMLLTVLGARVYGRIASGVNEMDAPLILSYVTEKLRSCDASAVSAGENGELQIREQTQNGVYVTWIYVEEGRLKEVFLPEARQPSAEIGTVVAEAEEFQAEECREHFWKISVTDSDGAHLERYFMMRACGQR